MFTGFELSFPGRPRTPMRKEQNFVNFDGIKKTWASRMKGIKCQEFSIVHNLEMSEICKN